ncbi:hypothetical protein DERP_013409 [Dermatophagoides pteronyssinus]|nr:hypothetical protein DERP_013409 [Dermatophagoides pteronyssinus]
MNHTFDNMTDDSSINDTVDRICSYLDRLLNSDDNIDLNDLTKSTTTRTRSMKSITTTVFNLNGDRKMILEICLILSLLTLMISFSVYCILPNLRTVPGKCLMGLICNEFLTNLLIFIAIELPRNQLKTVCMTVAICLHYLLLSMLSWTNLIAFDIMRKVRSPTLVLRGILRYFILAHLFPAFIIVIALAMDFFNRHYWSTRNNNSDGTRSRIVNKILSFRPNYGDHNHCGISNVRAHFLFVVLPISLSFCFIVLTLIAAIVRIKSSAQGLSRAFKSSTNQDNNSERRTTTTHNDSNNSSQHRSGRLMASNSLQQRLVWYMKIFILLGVLNLLTLIGNAFLNNCQVANFWSLMLLSSHG